MSEERFFEQVKSSLFGYAPDVPTEAYSKMRRAFWWSNFTKLSATRFNMWYLLLMLGIGASATAVALQKDEHVANNSMMQLSPIQPQQAEQVRMDLTTTEATSSISSVCLSNSNTAATNCAKANDNPKGACVHNGQYVEAGNTQPQSSALEPIARVDNGLPTTVEVAATNNEKEVTVEPVKQTKGRPLQVGVLKDKSQKIQKKI